MTTYTEQIKELCEANSIEYFIHGYYILSTDEIIRNNLMKDPNDTVHFSLYIEKRINREDLQASRVKFVSIIKKIIKKHKKIIIEGQLNSILIGEIADNKKFDIILVKPKNKKTYTKNIINRFIEDPTNYGRIGWMKTNNELNKKKGLHDYIKNGINGKIIQKLLKTAVEQKYHVHNKLHDYYKQHYNNLQIYLSS
jgi:hypothetical protein